MDYIGGMVHARNHPSLHRYVDALRGKVRAEDYLLGISFLNYVNTDLKFGDSIIDYYTVAQLGIDGAFIPNRWHDERLQTDIVRKIDGHPYLLFAFHPRSLSPNFEEVSQAIRADYVECETVVDSAALFVQRYTHPLSGCKHEYQPIQYDNGIAIVDHFGAYDPVNDRVQIVTGWEIADEQQLYEYNVSFQILTPDREKHGQIDEHLYSDIVKWYELEMSTAHIPPGDYRLLVIVYDRYTGKRVFGTDLISGEYGEHLPLLTFTVDP